MFIRSSKSRPNQVKPEFEIGDSIFYAMPWLSLVVTATIVELQDIYKTSDGKSVWHGYNSEGTISCTMYGSEKDELGYAIHVDVPIEKLSELERVNQLIWIDEPVGHAVQLGSDIFLTLDEALKFVPPNKKRGRYRRFRRDREKSMNFIAGTHIRNGYPRPNFPTYKNKKVYVRVK